MEHTLTPDQRDAMRYRMLRDETPLVASRYGEGLALSNLPKKPDDAARLDEWVDAEIRRRETAQAT